MATRKINYATSLNKTNQKISDLIDEAFTAMEFNADEHYNTREGYIVGNIKNYEWLDENDVLKAIRETPILESLQPEEKAKLLAVFKNSNRLNNIRQHTAEILIEQFREEVCQRVHLPNFKDWFAAYHYFYLKFKEVDKVEISQDNYAVYVSTIADSLKENYYLKFDNFKKYAKFFNRRRKNKTPLDFENYIISRNSEEYKEYNYLEEADCEVYTFGRSGGWLSVTRTHNIEDFEPDSACMFYDLKDEKNNFYFNNTLREYDFYSVDKKKVIQELEEFIESHKYRKEAIDFVLEKIKKESLGFKQAMIDQLSEDMVEYHFDSGSFEQNISLKYYPNQQLIKTSKGISVEVDDFLDAFRLIKESKNIGEIKNLGGYSVTGVIDDTSDVIIELGCHIFSVNKTEKFLKENDLI